MTAHAESVRSQRVAVLAPIGKDAELTAALLNAAAIETIVCPNLPRLVDAIHDGVGLLLVDAITNRDYPLVQAAILFITAIFVAINFLVDLSYGALDPRIRLQ